MTLIVKDFTLEKFIFNSINVFELQHRDAYVKFENIVLQDCIFKNSAFLRNIYSEFEMPYKKIFIYNFQIYKSTFVDSSLLNLDNINLLEIYKLKMRKITVTGTGV